MTRRMRWRLMTLAALARIMVLPANDRERLIRRVAAGIAMFAVTVTAAVAGTVLAARGSWEAAALAVSSSALLVCYVIPRVARDHDDLGRELERRNR